MKYLGLMEETGHVSEIIFNWAMKVGGGIILFIIGWLTRVQFQHNKTEKGLAVNLAGDLARDMEIKEIKQAIKELKIDFINLKLENTKMIARVNLMIEKMK